MGSSSLSLFESITIKYQGLAPPLVNASNASLPVEESEVQSYINLEPFSIVTLQENASPIRCPPQFRSQGLFDRRSKTSRSWCQREVAIRSVVSGSVASSVENRY